jgi:hypothetical protein
LFSTATDLGASPEFHVAVDDRVARAIDIEASASFSKPALKTTVTADAETTDSVDASVSITQLTFEGGVRIAPTSWSARRAQFFVVGGGGYLRQLYESRTLVETGRLLYVGGGAAIPLRGGRSSAQSRRVGLRVDGRATVFSGGVTLDDSTRVSPTFRASLFASF